MSIMRNLNGLREHVKMSTIQYSSTKYTLKRLSKAKISEVSCLSGTWGVRLPRRNNNLTQFHYGVL